MDASLGFRFIEGVMGSKVIFGLFIQTKRETGEMLNSVRNKNGKIF